MKKKASWGMGTITAMIILLVFLVLMLLYLGGPDSIWRKTTEGIGSAISSILPQTEDTFDKPELVVDEQVSEGFDQLINLFQEEKTGPCVAAVSLSLGQFSIRLFPLSDDLGMTLANPEGQIVDTTTVRDRSVCLVNAESFYQNYVENDCIEDGNCVSDFEVTSLKITDDSLIIREQELERGDYVYITSTGERCFFGVGDHSGTYLFTNPPCEVGSEGLTARCFAQMRENETNIPSCNDE